MLSPTPLAPYAPKNVLLPPIGEHTLVRPHGTDGFSAQDGIDELCRSIRLLLHDLEQEGRTPMTVLDIAVRMGLSRGVVILVVAELLRRNLVRVSRQISTPSDPRTEVRDAWSDLSHCDPELRSAKVLVMGDPELSRTFIGSCSEVGPISHGEVIYVRNVGIPSSSPDAYSPPVTARVSMGRIPLKGMSLHLLGGVDVDVDVFSTLWSTLVRDACAALVVTHADDLEGAAVALGFLAKHRVPALLVLHHGHETPDLEAVRTHLGLAEERTVLCDVRSRPATRAALGDVIDQRTLTVYDAHPIYPETGETA
ncbi:hypothetical protein [Nocardiopsis alba]|uniref:hypothetical protein n=1 Tax=Nocardiopsis alba TaxID=53437 RepID=UPI0033FDF96B